MDTMRTLTPALIIIALLLGGCSSSRQTADETGEKTVSPPSPAPAAVEQSGTIRHDRVDTVDVRTQGSQKPSYESRRDAGTVPASPGMFTVQVGAYKSQDGADRIAETAKERFGRGITVTYDPAGNLYKVMVGTFLTKDEARNFRDDMVRKYPTDYKDAWVSEHVQR